MNDPSQVVEMISTPDQIVSQSDMYNYLEIVEKTNQQLSLWFNPYAIMVTALAVIVGILTIAAAIIVYRMSKDYKDFLNTLKSKADDTIKLVGEQIERFDDEVKTPNEEMVANLRKTIAKLDKQKMGSNRLSIPKEALIKSVGLDFIYWHDSKGIRHTFPTDDIFDSWFPSNGFRPIIFACTDEQIANIPLGGNVVYRSGTRLVKIASDLQVYAVEPNNVLRLISNETIAEAIFGSEWKKILVTIPDVLFSDYKMGEVITDATCYSPNVLFEIDRLY